MTRSRFTKLADVASDRLRDKRIVIRIDADVPVNDDGSVDDGADWRLERLVPTLKRLREFGSSMVLVGHRGRPGGSPDPALSLRPVAQRLKRLLRGEIAFVDTVFGPAVDRALQKQRPGEIVMLENLRFEDGETRNSRPFAEHLASFGDLFVNEAFGVAHREHASIVGLPREMPSAAGLQFAKEVAELRRVREEPDHPFVGILGGAKVATKTAAGRMLLDSVDALLLGGIVANTVLAERGVAMGTSPVEEGSLALDHTDTKLQLPVDVATGIDKETSSAKHYTVDAIPDDHGAFDIGPQTGSAYADVIADAALVLWSGPMGLFENDAFALGTRAVAEAVRRTDARTVVGGGDTVAALQELGGLAGIDHVSTGGGSLLHFLAEGTLPGIEALKLTPF